MQDIVTTLHIEARLQVKVGAGIHDFVDHMRTTPRQGAGQVENPFAMHALPPPPALKFGVPTFAGVRTRARTHRSE